MATLDLQSYVQSHTAAILDAGQRAHDKLGRGALCVFPERDEGEGRTSVKYHTEQMLQDDNDPALAVVQRYDPASEAVLLVALESTRSIYTYIVDSTGARVALPACSW